MSKSNGKAVVSLDFLKSLKDREPVEVFVDAWGAVAYLVPFSSQQTLDHQMTLAQSYEKFKSGKAGRMNDFKAQAVGDCLVNVDGTRVCQSATDIEILKTANGAAINQLYERLQEISGMAKEGLSEAGKDSLTTIDSDSASDLRSLSDVQ